LFVSPITKHTAALSMSAGYTRISPELQSHFPSVERPRRTC
jgi:hypothetical protein